MRNCFSSSSENIFTYMYSQYITGRNVHTCRRWQNCQLPWVIIWSRKKETMLSCRRQAIVHSPCKHFQRQAWEEQHDKSASVNNRTLCIKSPWLFYYQTPLSARLPQSDVPPNSLQAQIAEVTSGGLCNHSLRVKPCFSQGSEIHRFTEQFK